MASVAKAPPAPKTVTATTLSPNHYDTTGVPTGLINLVAEARCGPTTPCTRRSPRSRGRRQLGRDHHRQGTFDGFASPTAANTPEHNQGNVTGKIYYYVNSANIPKAGLLPKELPPTPA